MFRIKGKLLVFIGSFLIVLYGVSAAFYARDDDAYKELSVLMKALNRIDADYVEVPDMNKVQEGAMRGLLDALDPHSSYLSKEQYAALMKRKENGKAGVGLVLSKRSDVIYVVSCEPDGPAANAGIRPGDYVIAIDGKDVEDKSVLELDSILHGAPGSKVKVSLFRNTKTKATEVELARSNQISNPVSHKMLEGKVGFLDIASLEESAVEQARIKLKTLISAGAQKIILDLRDCADGKASEGAELANYFLGSGILYYSQNRQGERVRVVEANPDKQITDLPLAVLIDGSTAGGAEIAAGALKDQKRASVIGEKSFGLAADQKTIQLKSGAILILSVAKHYTPGGKVIQDEAMLKSGIQPDIEVPDMDMRQELAVDYNYDEQDEVAKYKKFQERIDKAQIDKALEVLMQENVPLKKAA